jgi:3-hydroxyacyl-CoA dehydrogenase
MRAAVIGRPVSHSLSPLLHRAAYRALGLDDWTYDLLDLGAEDVPVLLAGLGEERFAPSPLLREHVAAGRLGRKSGSGFYSYEKKSPV